MAVNIDGNGLIALGGTSSTQGRVRLAEDSDNGTNYIELTAPASVGSDRVITFPDATTTVVGTDTTQTLTNKTIQGGAITSATAQASTSGTSIDFTGIPSWVKRITVMFSGVSTNGSSNPQIQLGDSGGVETTGYNCVTSYISGSTPGSNSFTSGFGMNGNTSAYVYHGAVIISLINSATNLWAAIGNVATTDAVRIFHLAGTKSLSATLDRVRITTVNGTDAFDAGTINILYE